MNQKKVDIPKSVVYSLFIVCLAVIFLVFIQVVREFYGDVNIKTENQRLKGENASIHINIQKMQDSIAIINRKIESVVDRERELSLKYDSLKTNIKSLKPKYEKAANRSANFNADSIRWYFSNL